MYPVLDPSLEADVDGGLEVWRGPIAEPAGWLDAFKGEDPTGRLGATSGGTTTKGEAEGRSWLKWIRGNLFIPDSRMLWIKPSIRRLKRLLAQHPVDALVSTGPPHSTHMIALGLKQAYPNLPWVADFRDPWSDMDYLEDFQLTARSRQKHLDLELKVVTAADRIVVTAPSAAQSVTKTALPTLDFDQALEGKCKTVWIPNGFDKADGFDKEDRNNVTTPSSEGPLVLGFFGALYGSRNAPGLWQAIRQWNSQHDARPMHIKFYGTLDPTIEAEISSILPDEAWSRCGSIPHDIVAHHMGMCHGLVMLQNNNPTGQRTIPGKAFEYLAAGRPLVVAGALNSDLERLVQSWGCSMCAMDDVAGFLLQLGGVARGQTPQADSRIFQRDVLSQQFAQLLDSLMS